MAVSGWTKTQGARIGKGPKIGSITILRRTIDTQHKKGTTQEQLQKVGTRWQEMEQIKRIKRHKRTIKKMEQQNKSINKENQIIITNRNKNMNRSFRIASSPFSRWSLLVFRSNDIPFLVLQGFGGYSLGTLSNSQSYFSTCFLSCNNNNSNSTINNNTFTVLQN